MLTSLTIKTNGVLLLTRSGRLLKLKQWLKSYIRENSLVFYPIGKYFSSSPRQQSHKVFLNYWLRLTYKTKPEVFFRLGAPISAPNASALDRASSPLALTLREALIIGSNSSQLKFSELTMDMYRIMQTLEREPNTDVNHLYDESPRQRNPPTPSAINNKGKIIIKYHRLSWHLFQLFALDS